MREAMEPLLYKYGVDVLLAGHVHAYERTHPVYNNATNPCGTVHLDLGDAGNREGAYIPWLEPQPSWSAFHERHDLRHSGRQLSAGAHSFGFDLDCARHCAMPESFDADECPVDALELERYASERRSVVEEENVAISVVESRRERRELNSKLGKGGLSRAIENPAAELPPDPRRRRGRSRSGQRFSASLTFSSDMRGAMDPVGTSPLHHQRADVFGARPGAAVHVAARGHAGRVRVAQSDGVGATAARQRGRLVVIAPPEPNPGAVSAPAGGQLSRQRADAPAQIGRGRGRCDHAGAGWSETHADAGLRYGHSGYERDAAGRIARRHRHHRARGRFSKPRIPAAAHLCAHPVVRRGRARLSGPIGRQLPHAHRRPGGDRAAARRAPALPRTGGHARRPATLPHRARVRPRRRHPRLRRGRRRAESARRTRVLRPRRRLRAGAGARGARSQAVASWLFLRVDRR
eukprot:ctg_941.g368